MSDDLPPDDLPPADEIPLPAPPQQAILAWIPVHPKHGPDLPAVDLEAKSKPSEPLADGWEWKLAMISLAP